MTEHFDKIEYIRDIFEKYSELSDKADYFIEMIYNNKLLNGNITHCPNIQSMTLLSSNTVDLNWEFIDPRNNYNDTNGTYNVPIDVFLMDYHEYQKYFNNLGEIARVKHEEETRAKEEAKQRLKDQNDRAQYEILKRKFEL